jgi:hypothetical protein
MTEIDDQAAYQVTVRGMFQILRYNWTYYAVAIPAALVGLGLVIWTSPSTLVRVLLGAWSACVAAGVLSSLAVSHYVYDRSPLSRWHWVAERLPSPPRRWVNLHAGLDETSTALRQLFPPTEAAIWEMYDPAEMTEGSIARARRITPSAIPATRVDFRRLPSDDAAWDAVFLIFAAHELRSPHARLLLFRELRRVLRPRGTLLLVEHLRDLANVLAFGPGAWHFYPRREWLRLADQAGFVIVGEFPMTIFVRVFLLMRPAQAF